MFRFVSRRHPLMLAGLLVAFCATLPAQAQTVRRMVTQPVDDNRTIALAGDVRPEVASGIDRGLVDDTLPLEHLQLLLKRPAETEAALVALIDELHNPKSPQYHHWLTNTRLAGEFGPAPEDVTAVTDWLVRQGFTVNFVQANRMMVDFSGSASQVRATFKTEIHHIEARGALHIANMSEPQIPAALADAVHGVVSLHDFRPHTNFKAKPKFTTTGGYEAVVPGDLAKIYHMTPLYTAGYSGQGQTIVVIEDTNVYSTADWTAFRNKFGLKKYAGTFTQVHPAPGAGGSNCGNPGVLSGNEGEAELDAEWASAAAPSAAIVLASCSDTSTTFGGLIALQNLLNSATPPGIVSISYGECEPENGATANAAYSATYQQAVALGTSVFVSSGDEGAASCDADRAYATHGISVSGFASTPYNVAVGGTDFADSYLQTNANYWGTANSSTYESALSYVPEIPWNDSCASILITAALGYTTPYGSGGSCNSSAGQEYILTASGSGGPSRCAAGSPKTGGVVGGSCQGYAKPSWQSLYGNPADGYRDIPDVSLFAANGVWGHYYVYCDSDVSDGGVACTGDPSNWSGAGGTSFSSPIWAGIQALINQKTGSLQGNPNPTLYALANNEYGTGGDNACASTRTHGPVGSCIFYDVVLGDMDVVCVGKVDCYTDGSTYGTLSRNSESYLPAYKTNKGWDFATGIGTVNVNNLVNAWPTP